MATNCLSRLLEFTDARDLKFSKMEILEFPYFSGSIASFSEGSVFVPYSLLSDSFRKL